jgi:hypothetical protein
MTFPNNLSFWDNRLFDILLLLLLLLLLFVLNVTIDLSFVFLEMFGIEKNGLLVTKFHPKLVTYSILIMLQFHHGEYLMYDT